MNTFYDIALGNALKGESYVVTLKDGSTVRGVPKAGSTASRSIKIVVPGGKAVQVDLADIEGMEKA